MVSKERIKVGHIITRMIIGGAQENTLLSVTGLQQTQKYDVALLSGPALGPEGDLIACTDGRVRFVSIPCLRRAINPLHDICAFIQLVMAFKRERFTIVHTHSSKAGILGRLAARLAGVPFIIHTIHGLPFFKGQQPWLNRLFIRLERWAAAWTSRIVAVAPTLVRDARQANIGSDDKFSVIYSGMDMKPYQDYAGQRSQVRQELGIPKECLVIGKIARLFHLKGHDALLRAAARLKNEFPQLRILLIGEGLLRAKLENMVQELGLAQQVIFTGLLAPIHIPRVIQAIDVLAHVSLREGLPRAVVQAGAAGKPAVCFDVDGAGDVIDHASTGYLVPAGDIDALVQRLAELLRNDVLRTSMGEASRCRVAAMFSAQRMIRDIDCLYEDMITCGR